MFLTGSINHKSAQMNMSKEMTKKEKKLADSSTEHPWLCSCLGDPTVLV